MGVMINGVRMCNYDHDVECEIDCFVCRIGGGKNIPKHMDMKVLERFHEEQKELFVKRAEVLGRAPVDKDKLVLCPFDFRFYCEQRCPMCDVREKKLIKH